jgi:hypothetical protein
MFAANIPPGGGYFPIYRPLYAQARNFPGVVVNHVLLVCAVYDNKSQTALYYRTLQSPSATTTL